MASNLVQHHPAQANLPWRAKWQATRTPKQKSPLKTRAYLQFLAEAVRFELTDPFGPPVFNSAATAEEFREAFTEQLAKVGFDESYEPTAGGNLLEDLIDRFHDGP